MEVLGNLSQPEDEPEARAGMSMGLRASHGRWVVIFGRRAEGGNGRIERVFAYSAYREPERGDERGWCLRSTKPPWYDPLVPWFDGGGRLP